MSKCEKTFTEKRNVILIDEKIRSAFNDIFANTVSNSNIPLIEHSHSNLKNTDPIIATVNSYGKHPSIERIKNRSWNLTFSFRKANSNKVSKIIDNLNIKKACQNSDIPIKIIKLNKDIIAPFIYENFKSCINKGEFPMI